MIYPAQAKWKRRRSDVLVLLRQNSDFVTMQPLKRDELYREVDMEIN